MAVNLAGREWTVLKVTHININYDLYSYLKLTINKKNTPPSKKSYHETSSHIIEIPNLDIEV